jgi:hypothetical protein
VGSWVQEKKTETNAYSLIEKREVNEKRIFPHTGFEIKDRSKAICSWAHRQNPFPLVCQRTGGKIIPLRGSVNLIGKELINYGTKLG